MSPLHSANRATRSLSASSTRKRVAGFACLVFLGASSGLPHFVTDASANTAVTLQRSLSADRSKATNLDGATVSGSAYIFAAGVPSGGTVRFWIDDPTGSGAISRTDSTAPYDLVGGSATTAMPWVSTSAAGGTHTVTAEVIRYKTVYARTTATFTVVNGVSTLFGAAAPVVAQDPDTSAVEVGVKWTTDVSGSVTGIRFYKGSANTGTHVGSLWSSSGSKLATATFTGESVSGWQQASLATPVRVSPGQVYVVSYWAPVGRYAADMGWFSGRGADSGPLHAPADGVTGPNGVYRYGTSGFPTDSYNASNYWVDVTFVADSGTTTTTAPPATTTTTAAPATTTTTAPPATTTTTLPVSTTTTVPPATTTTTAPSTTTTTTTPVTPTGWPSASTTGVPAGTSLVSSGGMTITTAGAVVEGKDFSGTVTIAANNVTLRRSRVRANTFALVRINSGITGARIEDVEVDGLGTSGTEGSMGIYGSAAVARANIHGVENGYQPDDIGGSIVDSYIHDLGSPGSPHYDGIQIDGGQSNVLISHNVISVPDQTSAVMIDNYFGSIDNITVDNNKLSGGTYTVYSDGQFTGGLIRGVRITNNRFGPSQYGYALIRNNTLAASIGNVRDSDGSPIILV